MLLDLSLAFDTIDHNNLFDHLEKDVGISGNALKLMTIIIVFDYIKSYFSERTQRDIIDGIHLISLI